MLFRAGNLRVRSESRDARARPQPRRITEAAWKKARAESIVASKSFAGVAILDIGGMRLDDKAAPIGIDERVTPGRGPQRNSKFGFDNPLELRCVRPVNPIFETAS